jgi:hypothetical protein
MRWPLVMLVAACGGRDEGVLLVVEAPAAATADRIEIILASADPATIEDVDHQRVQPASLEQEQVRYYRQRAITGAVDNVGALNGFAVRLEPNDDVPEGALIPILVGFDAQDQITAIGSVTDNGMPAPVAIEEGQLLRFTVEMSTMLQTDGAGGVRDGEVVSVECNSFRSGIAWRSGAEQVRLLLPDRSDDRDATDASARERDLDCDGHVADAGDCDDLRPKFHAGAEEACDGQDFDCDFQQRELVQCPDITTSCGATTGVGICDDGPNGTANPVACAPDPECACEQGPCASCVVPFEQAAIDEVSACTPAIAIHVLLEPCGGNCTVEVLKRPGELFKVSISKIDQNQFTDKLTGVADKIDLRVEAVDKLMAAGGDIVGGGFLSIINANDPVPRQLNFAIKLQETPSSCQQDTVMTCFFP